MPWYGMVSVLIGIWSILLLMSNNIVIISWVSIGLLAVYLTDSIIKVIENVMPRKYIKATKNKAVFITGCDSGFGRMLALHLDHLGFKVYAGCLFPEGEGAVTLKEKASRVTVIKLDVTNDEDVKMAYDFVEKDLRVDERLWTVVNNAGIAACTEVEFCPVETYRRLLDVNALGPIRVTKTFLPLLRKCPESRVVIVASLAGRYTFPGFSAYSMSKHAAVSFADGLRLEMTKWNISVHTIEPTLYNTPITNVGIIQKAMEKFWQDSPEAVKKSYGPEYLQDFKESITYHLKRAKPTEKVKEVIDDMVDAVAGTNPKLRYVPSVVTQMRARFLSSLSIEMRNSLLLQGAPRTPPADIRAVRKLPPLKDPRRTSHLIGPGGSILKRLYSMPITEKTPLTPLHTQPDIIEDDGFKFL